MSVNHASPANAAGAAGRAVAAAGNVRRRVRRMVLATAVTAGWLGLAVVAVVYIGGLLVQAMSLAMVLLPRGIVWLALAAQDGADWWSIAGRAGAAVAAAFASSQAIWWLIGLELIGVAALVGLQKLLRDETRGPDVEEVEK
jgi:hypothetical protein